jgi:hypothetical protein
MITTKKIFNVNLNFITEGAMGKMLTRKCGDKALNLAMNVRFSSSLINYRMGNYERFLTRMLI